MRHVSLRSAPPRRRGPIVSIGPPQRKLFVFSGIDDAVPEFFWTLSSLLFCATNTLNRIRYVFSLGAGLWVWITASVAVRLGTIRGTTAEALLFFDLPQSLRLLP